MSRCQLIRTRANIMSTVDTCVPQYFERSRRSDGVRHTHTLRSIRNTLLNGTDQMFSNIFMCSHFNFEQSHTHTLILSTFTTLYACDKTAARSCSQSVSCQSIRFDCGPVGHNIHTQTHTQFDRWGG